MWLLVLVLQLLKAPIASSSSCRYKGHKEVISVQGGYNCKQTRVKLGMCVGTCKSYAIPVPAEDDGNDPRFQTVCECCAPKEVRQKPVRFGDGCEQSIVVSQICSCECKNCSGFAFCFLFFVFVFLLLLFFCFLFFLFLFFFYIVLLTDNVKV